jgi:hypothetical protein
MDEKHSLMAKDEVHASFHLETKKRWRMKPIGEAHASPHVKVEKEMMIKRQEWSICLILHGNGKKWKLHR